MKNFKDTILEKSIPEPNTGCWLWTGVNYQYGYGMILRKFNTKQKTFLAHRASYAVFKGPIPEGMLVCHKCDTPQCVNPDHLFLGTHQDNTNDCKSKNRNKRFMLRFSKFCKRGHEFTPENTRIIKIKKGRYVGRACRLCSNASERKKYYKKKGIIHG